MSFIVSREENIKVIINKMHLTLEIFNGLADRNRTDQNMRYRECNRFKA